MRSIFPLERSPRDPSRHHRAAIGGECVRAQSDSTPPAGSVSLAPSGDRGWLGRGSEPASTGGESAVRDAEAGSASALSERGPAVFGRSGAGAAAALDSAVSVNAAMRSARSLMKSLLLGLIRFYQACLSPAIPSSCRFHPSCSAYAYEAVETWGARRGAMLAVRRVLRCRPWGGYGYDPVQLPVASGQLPGQPPMAATS